MNAEMQKQAIEWALAHHGEDLGVVEDAKNKINSGDIAYWAPEQITYFLKLIPAVDLHEKMDGSITSQLELDKFMESLGFKKNA